MSRGSRFQDEYPVTAFLVLFNIAFFFLETIGSVKRLDNFRDADLFLAADGHVSYALGSLTLEAVRGGQWWRLISAAFLHGNLLHLALNMFWLADLGRICEPLLSRWKFLAVYTASAIGGSLGSLAYRYVSHQDFPSLGASGAICGLLGLLLVYSIRE